MQRQGIITAGATLLIAGTAYLTIDQAPAPQGTDVERVTVALDLDVAEPSTVAPVEAQPAPRSVVDSIEEPAADAPDTDLEAVPSEDVAALRAELKAAQEEIIRLERHIRQLDELDPASTFARWYWAQDPRQRPTGRAFREMRDIMQAYRVDWSDAEGHWLRERLERSDWLEATADLSIIRFLGPERLMRDLPQWQAQRLRADYAGEGVFR